MHAHTNGNTRRNPVGRMYVHETQCPCRFITSDTQSRCTSRENRRSQENNDYVFVQCSPPLCPCVDQSYSGEKPPLYRAACGNVIQKRCTFSNPIFIYRLKKKSHKKNRTKKDRTKTGLTVVYRCIKQFLRILLYHLAVVEVALAPVYSRIKFVSSKQRLNFYNYLVEVEHGRSWVVIQFLYCTMLHYEAQLRRQC